VCGAAMATGGDLRAMKQQKRFLTTCCTKIMASVPSIISRHNSTVLMLLAQFVYVSYWHASRQQVGMGNYLITVKFKLVIIVVIDNRTATIIISTGFSPEGWW